MDAVDGTPFGRYRLIELLGRGGMGEVWRAFDTVTERVVAVKVLPTQYADDAVFQERFRREARSAAALDEPHVVPIHDFGEIDGRLFVTMRLIKGRDLQEILRAGPIAAARAVAVVEQVAEALHAAHLVGLVHRDVKPSNILVADNDFAYLIDFGIARAAGQAGLTSTGGVVGTWAYMAPERLSHDQADARADVYALTCVLHECLTGRPPFPANSLERHIAAHLTDPPPRPSLLQPEVPAALDGVIATGMAKNPDQRYASTSELAQAARAALGGPPSAPHPTPTVWSAPPHQIAPEHPTRLAGGHDAAPTRWSGPPAHVGPPPLGGGTARSSTASRRRLLIALLGAGAVVAAVAAVTLLPGDKDPSSPPVSSTGLTPTVPPNSGPFTGTFTVAMGPKTYPDGTPAEATAADAQPYTETWRLRSACGANGCVATASTGGQYPVREVVFDKVGDRWVAVATSRRNCNLREDDEAWNVIVIQPRPDGAMSGESTQATTNNCNNKRTAVFTRAADTDVARLPDPAGLPPRAESPAEALHGQYHNQVTFSDGTRLASDVAARTDCLRTGERCMSFFLDIKSLRGEAFVFATGAWTRNEEFENTCSTGGTFHVRKTGTLPLPQPPQDPIASLSGHGYSDAGPGTQCRSKAYDETFTRTGD